MRDACSALRAALRQAARFTLRADPGVPWPYGKEIRAQCGGLRGLARVLDTPDVPGVPGLIEAARTRWGSLDALPFSELVRDVARYVPRRRAR